jgi:hypothetical protein
MTNVPAHVPAHVPERDPYARMPASVRIGCHLFRVETGDVADHESAGTFGCINYIAQKIVVRPGMSAQNLANTFIHEVLHGLHWWMGAGRIRGDEAKRDYEEQFTCWGANGLCAFWQDNPDAIQWLNNLLMLP